MTEERRELIEMVSSMTDEQFSQFFIKAIQEPETRAAVVDILEKAGLLDNGGKEDAQNKQN